MMRQSLSPLLGDGLFISDSTTWRSRRPLVADIVHKTRVPSFGTSMSEATLHLLQHWKDMPRSDSINLLADMAELTAEIISRAVFGQRLGRAALAGIVEGFGAYQARIDSFNLPYFMGVAEGGRVGRGRPIQAAVQKVHSVIDHVVNEHIEGRGDHGSMVDLLVRRNQKNPELGLDLAALRNEAATIFMAGHETTAVTLTWAFYMLSKAPWAEERLLQELREVVGDRDPTIEDVPRLEYARAIIEETLRLYPAVPILPRQAASAIRIGDIDVEQDALVLVVPWLLHRADDLWEAPTHFRPERFLNSQRPTPYTYIPFSVGPRICAGLNFGLSESILCLALIARHARLEVAPGFVADPVCRLSLRPSSPILMKIEPRH
jgi:cytochrome P450